MARIKRITGWHVFAALMVFFSAIVVANGIFLTYAIRSFPGESEKKSYMQGLRYNQILDERAKQASLGWRAEIVRAENFDDKGVLELRLVNAKEVPLTKLAIEGVLKRPAHQGDDHAIAFVAIGGGVYQASIDVLGPGAWDLVVRASNAYDEQFDIEKRVIIQ